MSKLKINETQLHNFFSDLSINIEKISMLDSDDLKNNIIDYANSYCSNIDDDTLKFVSLCSIDSYFLALKTFENSLKNTLLSYPNESTDDL